MSTKPSSTENSIDAKRTLIADADSGSLASAQENVYEFVLAGDQHVNVKNTSYDEPGHVYTVAVEDDLPASCTCPAFEHHDGPCKHVLACLIRAPIMAAVSGVKPVIPDGGETTEHVEPADQGGEKYVRCEGYSRELLSKYGGRAKLSHADDCPLARDQD